jgi:hypothetical protein
LLHGGNLTSHFLQGQENHSLHSVNDRLWCLHKGETLIGKEGAKRCAMVALASLSVWMPAWLDRHDFMGFVLGTSECGEGTKHRVQLIKA